MPASAHTFTLAACTDQSSVARLPPEQPDNQHRRHAPDEPQARDRHTEEVLKRRRELFVPHRRAVDGLVDGARHLAAVADDEQLQPLVDGEAGVGQPRGEEHPEGGSRRTGGRRWRAHAGALYTDSMAPPAAQTTEYRAARESCALVDLSSRQQLRVTGPDRVSFVQGMVTNDVEKLAVGASFLVAMLTAKGAMVGDGRVVKLADEMLIDTGAGFGAMVCDFLNKYLISEITRWSTLRRGGAGVVGTAGGDVGGLDSVGAAPRCRAAGQWAGRRRQAQRARAGEGRALGVADGERDETFEVLRVEAGVPKFGVDMTETTIPLEANLEKAIHYQKGCYIGQEVIARATYRGQMNKKLVGLLLGEALAEKGAGEARGQTRSITSVVRSELKQQNVALAYVHRDHLAAGTTMELAPGVSVSVATLPFV